MTRPRFPSFDKLRSNFPERDSDLPNDCQSYTHKCAIRMSHALHGSGINLSDYRGNTCGINHARGAQGLRNYLANKFGSPQSFRNDREAKAALRGRQGIIFFDNTDHIDLYDRDRTVGSWATTPEEFNSALRESRRVDFWDMTPPNYPYNPPNQSVIHPSPGEFYPGGMDGDPNTPF